MWDTQGLDYKISQEYILNEVKRIFEDGLNKGPDPLFLFLKSE